MLQAGKVLAVDLTGDEDAACRKSALQVAVTAKGGVCSISKRGNAAILPNTLMVSLAAMYIDTLLVLCSSNGGFRPSGHTSPCCSFLGRNLTSGSCLQDMVETAQKVGVGVHRAIDVNLESSGMTAE